jgi:hypothetical protein
MAPLPDANTAAYAAASHALTKPFGEDHPDQATMQALRGPRALRHSGHLG